MKDEEVLSIGKHQLVWIDAPHMPHGWDCGYLYEMNTSTLFCSDLFTQPGSEHEPITEDDVLESSEMMRKEMDYYSHGSNQKEILEKLSNLNPKILACMHGSAWKGDGKKLLNALSNRISK